MILGFVEIFDILVMTVFIGFIFSDFLSQINDRASNRMFDWRGFKFSIIAVGPAIVLHELGHKFVAMAFGFQATFYAFYHDATALFLAVLAILFKFLRFGFLFIIPGYVSYPSAGSPLQDCLIAFAGPGVNLLIWLAAWVYLKYSKVKSRRTTAVIVLTKRINLFLFIFNMLPIPPFDGYHVFSNLLKAF